MSYADEQSEKELKALEKRIKAVYRDAYNSCKADADDYFATFKDRYEKEKAKWKAGVYTDEQFKAWCRTQLARGKRWNKLKGQMAERYVKANEIAATYINGTTPAIFANNANYTAYEISQHFGGADFELVDENVVKNLIENKGNYTEFRTVKTNPTRDYSWNSEQIQNALTSGIIRGDSIEEIAQSFMVVQQRNYNAAVRNARTACTSAENAGRISTMKAAQAQGIEVRKRWLSAHDGRVRDSHAHLDGQIRDIDKAFDNGLMFPADSAGRPEEVYNCRCTLTYIYPKYDAGIKSNESYKEWKAGKLKAAKDRAATKGPIRSRAEQTKRAEELVPQMSAVLKNECKWNHTITRAKESNAAWEDGVIALFKDASDESIVHELTHTYSYVAKGYTVYLENQAIEESAVEFFAREFSKQNKIDVNPALDEDIYLLTLINQEGKLYSTNYEFALDMINVDIEERYRWLLLKVSSSDMSDSAKDFILDRFDRLFLEGLTNSNYEIYRG